MNLHEHPEFKKIISQIESLNSAEVNLGWDAGIHYPDGTLVSDAALNHEFGAGREPARPVWIPVIAAKENSWISGGTKILNEVVAGAMTLESGLQIIGEVVVGDIVRGYKTNTPPPLSQKTLDARQDRYKSGKNPPLDFGNTLIDTGLMISTLRSQVIVK